jgi:hypothetical protein
LSHEALDFRDLTRAALERMLKNALMKKGDHADDKKKAAREDEDKEREDLADLDESKGKGNAPEVEEDDLHSSDIKAAIKGDDDDDKEDDDKPSKKPSFKKGEKPDFGKKVGGKKAPPFGKKKGGGFPFGKKGK